MRSASTRWFSSSAHQQAHGHPPHLGERLAHGRQAGDDDLRQLGVVEADDGEVVGNAQSAGPSRPHHSDRNVVVEREDRGRWIGQVEHPRGRSLRDRAVAEVRLGNERGIGHHAGRRQCALVAAQALCARDPLERAGDHSDAPVSQSEQVLGRRTGAGGMRGGDDGDPLVERYAWVDDDDRELALQRLQLRARLLRQHEHGAVSRAAHQAVEQRHLAFVLVQGRAEDDPHVLLVQRLGRTREDDPEVGRLDQRNGDADQSRAAAGESARVPVRAEPLLAHCAQHCLARVRRHVGPAVEHARDGGDRDAGRARDPANRGALAVVVGRVGHRLCLKLSPETVTGSTSL